MNSESKLALVIVNALIYIIYGVIMMNDDLAFLMMSVKHIDIDQTDNCMKALVMCSVKVSLRNQMTRLHCSNKDVE